MVRQWSVLPTDRNPHWLQIGMVWDNSGTNWQLQFCLSFVFLLFTPLCSAAFEDCQSLYEKRKLLSYSLFSKCNLSMLCSRISFFSDSKYLNSCVGYTHACVPAHTYTADWHEDTCAWTNKRTQTTSNSIKVKISVLHGLCDVTDCYLLGLAQRRFFLRRCRSDLKIRFWYLAWQLQSD